MLMMDPSNLEIKPIKTVLEKGIALREGCVIELWPFPHDFGGTIEDDIRFSIQLRIENKCHMELAFEKEFYNNLIPEVHVPIGCFFKPTKQVIVLNNLLAERATLEISRNGYELDFVLLVKVPGKITWTATSSLPISQLKLFFGVADIVDESEEYEDDLDYIPELN